MTGIRSSVGGLWSPQLSQAGPSSVLLPECGRSCETLIGRKCVLDTSFWEMFRGATVSEYIGNIFIVRCRHIVNLRRILINGIFVNNLNICLAKLVIKK